MTIVTRLPRALTAAALVATLAGVGAAGAPPASAEPYPVDYSVLALPEHLDPDVAPPGANDWGCRPSADHPRPVVLVHGLTANQNANWYALSPLLANDGYCVFTLSYGDVGLPHARGLSRVEEGAAEVHAFVARVLATTGASKVDVVAHSLGTLVTHYYVKNLGGDASVGRFVSLSGGTNGTTALGLTSIARFFGLDDVIALGQPVVEQLLHGSTFLAELNAGGVLRPSVQYTTIVTVYDELNTPYWSQFLPAGPNVRNLVLQDACPVDFSGHVRLAYSPNALRLVRNALDPAHARSSCRFVPAVF
jgi:triacylglycerol esterase/lipase EstA (alpha/beta hydrolase family)